MAHFTQANGTTQPRPDCLVAANQCIGLIIMFCKARVHIGLIYSQILPLQLDSLAERFSKVCCRD